MPTKKTRIPKEHTENADGLAAIMKPVRDRLDLHGEMLRQILKILTEDKQSDGPSLSDLLSDLIKRLDTQSRTLLDLTAGVVALRDQLPLEIVRAIDDNLDGSTARQGQPNGSGNGNRGGTA